MKFFALILFMQIYLSHDRYKVCTEDAKLMVDDVFAMIESVESDWSHPDHTPFKRFTASLQKFLRQCAQVDVPIEDYNDCVENVLQVLPEVGHLVDSVKRKNTPDIILDSSRVLYGLVTGLTMCLKDKGYNPILSNFF